MDEHNQLSQLMTNKIDTVITAEMNYHYGKTLIPIVKLKKLFLQSMSDTYD